MYGISSFSLFHWIFQSITSLFTKVYRRQKRSMHYQHGVPLPLLKYTPTPSRISNWESAAESLPLRCVCVKSNGVKDLIKLSALSPEHRQCSCVKKALNTARWNTTAGMKSTLPCTLQMTAQMSHKWLKLYSKQTHIIYSKGWKKTFIYLTFFINLKHLI